MNDNLGSAKDILDNVEHIHGQPVRDLLACSAHSCALLTEYYLFNTALADAIAESDEAKESLKKLHEQRTEMLTRTVSDTFILALNSLGKGALAEELRQLFTKVVKELTIHYAKACNTP
jgi:hypothetical protein